MDCLRAYSPETVVAEKFQAMVALGMLNSRTMDFSDLWAILEAFDFDRAVPARAIAATFERRGTPLPSETPVARTVEFANAKQARWTTFLRRTEIALVPDSFSAVQVRIAEFVWPLVTARDQNRVVGARWIAGGPW